MSNIMILNGANVLAQFRSDVVPQRGQQIAIGRQRYVVAEHSYRLITRDSAGHDVGYELQIVLDVVRTS